MGARRLLWLLAGCIALVGWSGRNAQAAAITYELVAGSLTSLTVGTGPNLIPGGSAPLTAATATIDFAPEVLDMTNLFVSAGSDTWNLSLQSLGTIDLMGPLSPPGTFPQFELQDGPVNLNSSLLGYPITANVFGSIVSWDADGLQIVMDVVGTAGSPTGALPTVKVDFFFRASGTNGATAIPEPGSELLFPAGLALLGWILRGQRRQASC